MGRLRSFARRTLLLVPPIRRRFVYLQSLEAERATYHQSLQDRDAAATAARSSLDQQVLELNLRNEQLDADRLANLKSIESLSRQVEMHRAQVGQATDAHTAAVAELDGLERDLHRTHEELEVALQQIVDLRRRSHNIESALRAAEQEARTFRSEGEKARDAATADKTRAARLEAERDELIANHQDDLSRTIAAHTALAQELREKIEVLDRQKQELAAASEAENHRLTLESQTLKAASLSQAEILSLHQKAVAESREKVTELENSLTQLAAEKHKQDVNNATLSVRLDHALKDMTQKTDEASRLQAKLEHATGELNDREKRLAGLEVRLEVAVTKPLEERHQV